MTCNADSNNDDRLLDAALASSTSTTRLYDAIGLEKTATAAEIRKAYFKLSLRTHPDRNPGDEHATARFQSLQKIYAILSDPEKRKLYDETGITDADDPDAYSEDRCESLKAYYKKCFKEVTGDAIDKFKEEYQGSDEETADVLSYYAEFEGDMDELFRHVMLSDPEVDSARFAEMVESALQDGRVDTRYAKYETWRSKLAKKAKRRTSKKTTTKRKASGASDFNLAQAILSKRSLNSTRSGGCALGDLASKYGVSMPDGEFDDPLGDEAAFKAAQQRMLSKK